MFERLMFFFDLTGTIIFAVTGAVSGVRLRLDLLGVVVFGCTVGVGGGILRDTIIGATPVAALQDETYLIACIAVSMLIFFLSPRLAHHREIIMTCDAFGLGVFTAIGAAKGAQYSLGPVGIMLCGVLSAVGGGIPAVLVSDFYATASLIGGGIYVLLSRVDMPLPSRFFTVAAAVILLRLLAMRYHLRLPARQKRPGGQRG